jgi:hypothetical protein
MEWGAAAVLTGPGTTTIAPGAVLNMDDTENGPVFRYLVGGHVLDNQGTAYFRGQPQPTTNYYDVVMGDASAVHNEGTFYLDARSFLWDGQGTAPVGFINTRALVKTGVGSGFVGVRFDNQGQVQIQAGGSLTVGDRTGALSTSAGPISAAAGTFLEVDGNWNITGAIQADHVQFANAATPIQVSIAGPLSAGRIDFLDNHYAITGAIDADVVTFALGYPRSASVTGSYHSHSSTHVSSGLVQFSGSVGGIGDLSIGDLGVADFTPATGGAVTLTFTSLAMSNRAELTGADNFLVAGPFTWDGGDLAGPSGATLTAQGGMTLSGGNLYDRTLINAGDAAWIDGTVSFHGTASFTNIGTFDDQIDGTFGSDGSFCPLFTNQGLFLKSGGNGTTYLNMDLINSGSLNIEHGTLNLHCGYVQGAGGSISGPVSGDVSNPGTYDSEPSPNPPVLTSYTQTATGTLVEQIGGLAAGTQYGHIIVNGSVNLAGSLQLALINGFAPQLNDQFTIIDNRGNNPVNGTFTNLPEGAIVWDSSHTYGFTISYTGGTGKDVVLTVSIITPPSSLSGLVYEDFNNDGQVDFGERGIAGVTIILSGTDDLGQSVNPPPQTTDSNGLFFFDNLRPGSYYLTETQPGGYLQGIDSVGTAGGSLVATDQFFIQLAAGVDGINYNYGERPQAGGAVQPGQTASIGFWHNNNGQTLIRALNGGSTSTQLAHWLAVTLPHMYGSQAGPHSLIHSNGSYFSNTEVAAFFQSLFNQSGPKLDAQVLATALSVYVTNATLDPTLVAASYGFTVSGDGAGTAAVNVGSNGDAFGVANNSTMTVMDLLLATDAQAVNGLLYNGNAAKRNHANTIYSAVNQAGDIG